MTPSGKLYIPLATENFSHDADGNLTDDARWDAENRLKQLTTQASAVTAGVPELRLSFSYDAQSRRVRKKVEEKVSGVWELPSDVRFIYDGWNLSFPQSSYILTFTNS